MIRLKSLIQKLRKIHRLSKVAVLLGVTLMTCFYIIAAIALRVAPKTEDYFYVLSIYHGALQAAPACLAVGVCAGLLGDLMLRGKSSENF